MRNWILILSAVLLSSVQAEEITLTTSGLSLNANLEKAADWPLGPTLLLTHDTLSSNKNELITALQERFLEQGLSSLAINLSLGLDHRQGPYDCATPSTHRHTDAITEIGQWVDWLKKQKVQQIVLLGHSRGGNQTARFIAAHDDPIIKQVILVAPQTWTPGYATQSYEKSYHKPLAPILRKAQALIAQGKPDTPLQHTDFIDCKDTTVTAGAFASYYAADPSMDTPYLLPTIRKPVLVFAATEDQEVEGLDQILAPMAEAGMIELVVMEGADHTFRDLYSEELVDRTLAFIGE